MKRDLYILGLMGFLIYLLAGCSTASEKSDNVNQARIYQSYSASYSKENNKTSVTAQFRFGDFTGTTLELTGKSNIIHDSISLSRTVLLGTIYDGNSTGLKETHQYSYTNNEGEVFTNSATIVSLSFKNPPSSFTRSQDLVIQWEGTALTSGEEVDLYLSSDLDNAFATTSTVGATSITIPKEKLTSLFVGTKKMHLQRSRSINLQQATSAGGSFRTSYETEKLSIELLH